MARALQPVADHGGEAEGGNLPLDVVDRSAAAEAVPAKRLRCWRRLLLVPLVMIPVAIGGLVGIYVQPPGLRIAFDVLGLEPGGGTSDPIAVPPSRPVSEAVAAAGKVVVALGTLLPQSDLITVAPPFGSGDARVASLSVDEGDRVEAGELLAVLDSDGQLRSAVETARAVLAVSEATLEERRDAIRASREEAAAALGRVEAAAENARRELARSEALVNKGVVSESVADERRTTAAQAARAVDQARATLSRYSAAAIDAQPDVLVALRNVEAARAELVRAEADAEAARIRAPITGTVLKIHVRPGERPGDDGILDLGDIERMMAEIEVYQTDIGRVEPGQPVEFTAQALPRTLTGKVSRIGLKVGRQDLVGDDPAANTDARVVEVIASLDEPSSEIARRFTDLQVTARIGVAAAP